LFDPRMWPLSNSSWVRMSMITALLFFSWISCTFLYRSSTLAILSFGIVAEISS